MKRNGSRNGKVSNKNGEEVVILTKAVDVYKRQVVVVRVLGKSVS